MPKYLIPILFLLLFLYSCGKNGEEINVTEITIDQAELVLSAETDPDIANPSIIRTTDNGFYIYDFGVQKILYYDKEGNQQLKFGHEGQGPGEFQGAGGFWVFDDELVLFDQRGAKILHFSRDGTFLKEESIEQEDFAPGLTMSAPGRFYIPLNGKDGKLAKFIDKTGDTRFAFGEADIPDTDFDAGKVRQSIERGNLPDNMLGRVSISAGDERVYLFHTAVGKLQAYDTDGNLQAEIILDLPVMEESKQEFFEHSKQALERGFFILFSYINDMSATGNGVALLLNTPSDHPVTVLSLDKNLRNKTIIQYETDTLEHVSTFSLDEDKNSIYLVNMGTSEIFRAPWH